MSCVFVAGLTQLRIDSDDRTLFAIGMIDHFEKLHKEVNESHVILRGMAARVKERLKIFGTMPALEVNICSVLQLFLVSFSWILIFLYRNFNEPHCFYCC